MFSLQPLFFAASKGNTSLLRALVECGASTKVVCNQGESPLTVAYSNNHMAAVDWLESLILPKMRVSCSRNDQSDEPLHRVTHDVALQSDTSPDVNIN